MWLENSMSSNAGRRNRSSRDTSGCVGLKGAPGKGPKPVMRIRSLSFISPQHARDLLRRHRDLYVLTAASTVTGMPGLAGDDDGGTAAGAALREIPGIAGVHLMAFSWEDAIPEILERAGIGRRAPSTTPGGLGTPGAIGAR